MQITESMFKSAVKELRDLFLDETIKLSDKGFNYKPTDNAPESFNELKISPFNKKTESIALQTKDTLSYVNGKYVDVKGDNVRVKRKLKIIPVANYGSSSSIYGNYFNTVFRFWHDALHLDLNEDFSMKGEEAVANQHIQAAKDAGLSNLAIAILTFDTIGQVRHYYSHKEFVNNQESFIRSCLQHGMSVATRIKH
ncbi:hypothetical protein [Marinomonas phage CPP1m]|uniref:Uncharacterized protein n=2 Tax=Murciavirus CPP1m TaxID=2733327 RepID=A0A1W5S0X8_9CAUD|nr:hypothetical protein HOR72_gp06 [Marinomonas phage CPP1m]ARB11225.1 hypothetical protein [Marinomonas phage CPP1m]ARB11275.1 hypothetical protein [Marinomonas phage CPG1g]